jgi:hypothetical protein
MRPPYTGHVDLKTTDTAYYDFQQHVFEKLRQTSFPEIHLDDVVVHGHKKIASDYSIREEK